MRAERRVGELIAEQRETVGLATGGDAMKARVASGPEVATRPTLADAGIDKHLADRARKLNAEAFEQRLQEGRARILDVSERVRVDVLAPTAHVGRPRRARQPSISKIMWDKKRE